MPKYRGSKRDGDGSPPRVLVLGTADHPRGVTAHPWTAMPSYVNVADYDVVIINAAAVEEQESARIQPYELPGMDQFGRLWFAKDTEVVVIMGLAPREESNHPFFWAPIEPERREQPGDVVQDVDAAWAWYLDRVTVYAHYFNCKYGARLRADTYFHMLDMAADTYDVHFQPLARARHGRPVAVGLSLTALISEYNGRQPVAFSSSAYALPTLHGVRSADVVNLVLQERYGFEIITPAPGWSGG